MTEKEKAEENKRAKNITLVLGVIGEDPHAVGIVILERKFRQAGFEVINIGAESPQEEFIQAAVKHKAQAIIVSSLYGQAEQDCQGFREKCVKAGLKDILLYIGGNLAVGKQPWERVEVKFKKLGFNRVYSPGTKSWKGIEDLKEDLKLKKDENKK